VTDTAIMQLPLFSGDDANASEVFLKLMSKQNTSRICKCNHAQLAGYALAMPAMPVMLHSCA